MNVIFDYDQSSLADAIQRSGVLPGDTLFCHSNLGFFGRPNCDLTATAVGQMCLDAVFDVIGDDGTFVVPTFSYSFVKGQDFDPVHTPSTCGALTEFVRNHPDAYRSHHPDFSVAAIGDKAEYLTAQMPRDAFALDGFFARFEKIDGKFCNFNFDSGSTFVHYVERTLNVPYRYNKKFFGNIIINSEPTTSWSSWYVHDLTATGLEAAFEPLHENAVASGISTIVPLGRGSICTLSARDKRQLIEDTLEIEPFFLTRGQGADPVSGIVPVTSLSETDAAWINTWRDKEGIQGSGQIFEKLIRVGVTSGSFAVFDIIARLFPVTIVDVPTGTQLGDVIVPERWELKSASVTKADGGEILEENDNPIAVHSRNYSGDVPGTILTAHLIGTDSGQTIDQGGWAIRQDALRGEIDPNQTYTVDIKTQNKFSAMRYAVLESKESDTNQFEFVDVSQDSLSLEALLIEFANRKNEPLPKILFYAQPFDPDSILAHYRQMMGTQST